MVAVFRAMVHLELLSLANQVLLHRVNKTFHFFVNTKSTTTTVKIYLFTYSLDSRGEVEGSSDNNSPPTSVIQGKSNNPQTDLWDQQRKNPAYDWLRGAFNGKVDEETLLTQLRQHR